MTFRERVFSVVAAIPKGCTRSYADVARLAGNPKAARAVGSILKTNFDIRIPCHRVIRSDGSYGGYNRGLAQKRLRLRKEGVVR